MSLVCRICNKGHYIYGGGNVQFCQVGTGCYHKIKRGKYKHEYQNENGLEDFCKFCYDNDLDGNLYKIRRNC